MITAFLLQHRSVNQQSHADLSSHLPRAVVRRLFLRKRTSLISRMKRSSWYEYFVSWFYFHLFFHSQISYQVITFVELVLYCLLFFRFANRISSLNFRASFMYVRFLREKKKKKIRMNAYTKVTLCVTINTYVHT